MTVATRLTGKRMAELREATGLTQEQFAELFGSSREYINLIESGRRPVSEHIQKRFKEKILSHLEMISKMISNEPID